MYVCGNNVKKFFLLKFNHPLIKSIVVESKKFRVARLTREELHLPFAPSFLYGPVRCGAGSKDQA